MKITNAEIVISAVAPEQYPQESIPEIALVGRSNVGKSSLINTLIDRKNLARTSSSPGKTQTLNFYIINNSMHIVDLPGYGYAKVSKVLRAKWGNMIETYLTTREQLVVVYIIVDLRHPPSELDKSMYQWLAHHDIAFEVIATKLDKIPKTKVSKHIKDIRTGLGMHSDRQLLVFSSETKKGKQEVWENIIYHGGRTSFEE